MKHNYRKRNVAVLLASLLFILLTFCIIFLKMNNSFDDSAYWRISDSKLTELKTISDQYIISQVGENRFKNDFKFLSDKSLGNPDQEVEDLKKYRIAYEYFPASKLSGEQQVMYAIIVNGEAESMYGLSNCINEPGKCDLKIDKGQAIVIAQKKGFIESGEKYSIDFLNSNTGGNWVWAISKDISKGSISSDCKSYSLLEIMADNGSLSPIRNEGLCP